LVEDAMDGLENKMSNSLRRLGPAPVDAARHQFISWICANIAKK
jgi:hypothetical protein